MPHLPPLQSLAANIRWHDLKGTEAVTPTVKDRDFVIATIAPPTKAQEVAADPNAPTAAAAAPAKGKAPAKGAAPAAPAAKAPAKAPAKKK